MSESTPATPAVTPATPATAPRARGYFNLNQTEDLDLADSVRAAARSFPAEMVERDITDEYLDSFEAALDEAHRRASLTALEGEESVENTSDAKKAAFNLLIGLKQIQSAAKQKHQMLAEDGDPETNFPTHGYLIGIRLDASRSILRQSAKTLIERAKQDSLPGFKTPAKIAPVEALLTTYLATKDEQQDATKDKELSRIDRDTLLNSINRRRAAIQHAADGTWPASIEANRPIRKSFSIPLNRSMGL